MQRRNFLRSASIGLTGAGLGFLAAPASANDAMSDIDAIRRLSSILSISKSEAATLWSDKSLREHLPVAIDSQVDTRWEAGGLDLAPPGVNAGAQPTSLSDDGTIDALAVRDFILATGHSFKNLFGSVLFSATLSKTTRIGGSYATKVRTNMTYSTSSLGLAAWVPKGVQSGRSVDTRRGTSHYSERVSTWFGAGGRFLDANVSLIVGALVRNNGTYTTTKKTEKPPWV